MSNKKIITVSSFLSTIRQEMSGAEILDIKAYDTQHNLLSKKSETIFNILNDTIEFKIHKILREFRFTTGAYNVEYQVIKEILDNLYIDEISSSRTEIRLIYKGDNIYNFKYFIGSKFPKTIDDKYFIEPSLTINNQQYGILNWIKDRITYPTKNVIILKLKDELLEDIDMDNPISINIMLSDLISDKFLLFPYNNPIEVNQLRHKNQELQLNTTKKSMTYKNWNSLVSSGSYVTDLLLNKYLSSGSLSTKLNVDYREHKNFIFYSSAEDRINNFKYKLELIESYNNSISNLRSSVSESAQSSSEYGQNILKYEAKTNNVLKSLDNYEDYLYYESSSYESSSYGKFVPTTWPKSNDSKPYSLYSITSSEANDWVSGSIDSASYYDNTNPALLTKLIPNFIKENEFNDRFITFTNMVAQQFDEVWLYIKHLDNLKNRDESLYTGIAKDLVYHVLSSYGWDGINDNQFDELWYYNYSTNQEGSYILTGSLASNQRMEWISAVSQSISTEDIQKEIWNRILNNLSYLNKTKGTIEGIRALINCYGIPRTVLPIKEYGSIDTTANTSYYNYDKFSYALKFNNDLYLEVQPPYESGSIEFRFKTDETTTQSIFESEDGSFSIEIAPNSLIVNRLDAISTHISKSMNDGEWWNFGLSYNSLQTYDLYLKRKNYERITYNYSASIVNNMDDFIIKADSESVTTTGTVITFSSSFASIDYNIPAVRCYDISGNNIDYTLNNKTVDGFTITSSIDGTFEYISIINAALPSYPSSLYRIGAGFSGSMQEFRYWSTSLDEDIFDLHVLSPTSYTGNSPTSSYNDLFFRLTLGTDTVKYDHSTTSSLDSQHPNQNTEYSASLYNIPTWTDFYEGVTEIYVQKWPDITSHKLISNKVKIDAVELTGSLSRDNRIESSSMDDFPHDNPKIGVYFSPTNEVDLDIAEYMSELTIDDVIGDWDSMYIDNYPELHKIRDYYFKQYTDNYNIADYFRLVNKYNHSLFRHIKEIIPAKARGLTGLVIEPHLLNRSKVSKTSEPEFLDETKETKIDIYNSSSFEGENLTKEANFNVGGYSGSSVYYWKDVVYDSAGLPHVVNNDSTLREAVQPYYDRYVPSGSYSRLTQGQKNHQYLGCRMVSAGWNKNSPDTIDGAPVAEYTETEDLILRTKRSDGKGNLDVGIN